MDKIKNGKKKKHITALKAAAAAAALSMVPVLAGCAAGAQDSTLQPSASESSMAEPETTQDTSVQETESTPGGQTTEVQEETNAPGTYRQVSSQEAAAMMEEDSGYIILDVRRPDEFSSGHIPGAVNIANESISEETVKDALADKTQRIYVYCRSGNRSRQASEKLAQMGYTNVVEFGGINTWQGEVE